jgi:hypothetical protein
MIEMLHRGGNLTKELLDYAVRAAAALAQAEGAAEVLADKLESLGGVKFPGQTVYQAKDAAGWLAYAAAEAARRLGTEQDEKGRGAA